MASFTAYVFYEDFTRLTNEVYVRGDGGSLYGQWTSTGNPVVHVAFSKTLPNHSGTRKFLSDSFKLCHIGEWRPVRTEQNYDRGDWDSRQREALLSKYSGRVTPARFLILDVNSAKIVPYLFDQLRIPRGPGRLEILLGQNPFNLALNNPQPAANPMPSQTAWRGEAVFVSSTSQGAVVRGHQWYSPETGGNEKVQFVFQKLQKVVQHGTDVEMSRDKTTHDMSMTLTDRHRRKWVVKFPWNFPDKGAELIKSVSTPGYGYQQTYVPGGRNLDKAVCDIISIIDKY